MEAVRRSDQSVKMRQQPTKAPTRAKAITAAPELKRLFGLVRHWGHQTSWGAKPEPQVGHIRSAIAQSTNLKGMSH